MFYLGVWLIVLFGIVVFLHEEPSWWKIAWSLILTFAVYCVR